ncbi:hypothetical protein BDC45DRAFT_526089 [Circinella umbellata]|nr:hypothetical protein BDC45DRAFT_526089 [Circinella umbellata]
MKGVNCLGTFFQAHKHTHTHTHTKKYEDTRYKKNGMKRTLHIHIHTLSICMLILYIHSFLLFHYTRESYFQSSSPPRLQGSKPLYIIPPSLINKFLLFFLNQKKKEKVEKRKAFSIFFPTSPTYNIYIL